jgi:hypothetical protein
VERGDTGRGRDGYGLHRRRRLGERRAYRPDNGARPNGTNGADDEYGQLLRRPGDPSPQPGRARVRPPGRFPPPPGNPADGFPPTGAPGNGGPVGAGPVNPGAMNGGPMNGSPMNGGPANRSPVNGGPMNGGPMPGRHYRPPNGRRVPPRADRPYRPQAPGPAGAMRGPWDQPGPGQAPGPSAQDPLGGWGRPPRAPSGPPPRADAGPQAYGNPPRAPGMPGFAGRSAGSRTAEPRTGGRDGWGRLGTQSPRGVPGGTAGPVIRQREAAVPDEGPTAGTQLTISIAPDGLASFARDLRALRAKAELDYPEMAEVSHYTMKTLASAAGGLRLPTLPVAVAYVRACGGNVAEWEERWQKLATKITADTAKKPDGDGDERHALPEPADTPARPEPPAPPAAQDAPSEPGEVYVITSAKLPRGVWGDGSPQEQGRFGGDGSPQEQGRFGGDRSPQERGDPGGSSPRG